MTAPSMAELIAENEQLRRALAEQAIDLSMSRAQNVIDAERIKRLIAAQPVKMAAGEGVRQWPRVAA